VNTESARRLNGGQLNSALAKALSRIQTEHLDLDPANATAFHHVNIVVVVMRDVLNHAEKHLAQNGGHGDVAQVRHLFQQEMETDFRAAMERLTGQKVIAFLSANNLEPDLAAEIFILDAPL
jgi:uncharacterized protein YbcI